MSGLTPAATESGVAADVNGLKLVSCSPTLRLRAQDEPADAALLRNQVR